MADLIILGQEKPEKNFTNSEKKVADLIYRYSQDEYDVALRDEGWDVFYQMSPLREGLLNWYPFEQNSEVLEVSSGFGGITGVLSRSVRKVTVLEESLKRAECIAKRYEESQNITVWVGSIGDLPIDKQYDYVVIEKALNTREELEQLIGEVYPFLKADGRLLFVCENRFGMKYWCGVPDPIENIPFAGIRRNDSKSLMTRQDLFDALVQDERVQGWYVYYPFPDYRLPQTIYTDAYLPKASVRDRVIPYYPMEQRKSLVCLENEISDALIANGVFHIFANSFLVECGKCSFQAETIFAALSTDRGKEHGFATMISNHNTVQKRVLHPDGKKSLNLIYQNQKELEAHGIMCVQAQLKDGEIIMPFVDGKSLIEYLQYLFFHESNKVEEIFDRLYEDIIKSSEHLAFSECAIKDKGLTEDNAGVILRKAYIDMIPYNSFYKDGIILFYDQEFVKEFFPAKYVLFRALRYTYIYIQTADQIIPLQYFKDKYGLSEIWHIFEREEACFVEDNRNYNLLTSFYQWAGVSPREVDANIEKLRQDTSPEKSGNKAIFKRHRYDLGIYEKDKKLGAVKKIQLDILKVFAQLCEKWDLSYCVFYGTLLGAVRHHGYVPWDDDVDVLMPRKDYDRLLELAPNIFEYPYFLQTPLSDTECFYGGYSKLRNSNTTGLEVRNEGHNCNQGIWIDIFPLDYVLEEEKDKEEQREKIQFYQRLLLKKTYPEKRILYDISAQEEEDHRRMSGYFSRETLYRNLHDIIVNFEGKYSKKMAVIARYYGKSCYKEYNSSDFEFLIKGQFEGMEVYLPIGYENCLISEYGRDYALYPEEEQRKPHHVAAFDTETPYETYIQEKNRN